MNYLKSKIMSKNTALTELKNKIKKRMDLYPNNPNLSERGAYDAYLNCLLWTTELLTKEREDIIDAILSVTGLNHRSPTDDDNLKKAEEYYKTTFNNNLLKQ
jgi:hypothetical protein